MMEVAKLASKFVAAAKSRRPGADAGWKSALDELLAEVGRSEERGVPRDVLRGALEDARRIHAESPFIKRLQEWPKGYAGDFETIEYICEHRNRARPGTIAHDLEQLALDSSIAQQHRNKVAEQAAAIARQVARRPDSRILVVGCGGGRDIRLASGSVRLDATDFVLNDADPEALRFARSSVGGLVGERTVFLEGNILRLVAGRRLGVLPFDLVLFGGVFDYLPSKAIRVVLGKIYKDHLNPGGRIVFTNIRMGNPYRTWIEYCADWVLIERDEKELADLCGGAGIPLDAARIHQDATGLAWIVECTKC